MAVQTNGRIEWNSAEETTIDQAEKGSKLDQLTIDTGYTGHLVGASTQTLLVLYHDAEIKGKGTGTWTGMELFTGEFDGKRGSIVIRQSGRFDNTDRTDNFHWDGTWETDPDSGTGELAGLRASGVLQLFHQPPHGEYTIDEHP